MPDRPQLIVDEILERLDHLKWIVVALSSFLAIALVVATAYLANDRDNLRHEVARNTVTNCAVKADVDNRQAATEALIAAFPDGRPGFPIGELRATLATQRALAAALAAYDCRGAP